MVWDCTRHPSWFVVVDESVRCLSAYCFIRAFAALFRCARLALDGCFAALFDGSLIFVVRWNINVAGHAPVVECGVA
jgi:hypothetical protein